MTRRMPLILWGAAGHAKVLWEFMSSASYDLVAVFDNDPTVISPFHDVACFTGKEGFKKWKAQADQSGIGFLVAIGGERGKARLEMQDWLTAQGLTALIARHPTAFEASDASVGAGSQLLAHAAICVEVRLGRGCIVNTGATVDHECVLGDGVHVAPGAHLGGCVEAGDYSMIGIGASVMPRIRIGTGAIVGAGAVVIRDVEPYTVVAGNPARVVGTRAE